MVSNKQGNCPFVRGLHLQTLTPIQLSYAGSDSSYGIEVLFSEKAIDFLAKMKPGEKGSLITPCTPEPTNDIATARFIAKMGLEILAHRLMDSPGANNELVDKPELDAIRNYARRGEPTILWPVSIRRIYPESFLFTSDSPVPYEVLHEFDLLSTTGSEYYAVVAIFGFEYVINLGGPELDGYQEWLNTNNMKSPLYCGKNIPQKGQAKEKGTS